MKKLIVILIIGLFLVSAGCGKSDDSGPVQNTLDWLGVPVSVEADLNFVETNQDNLSILHNSTITISTVDGSELPEEFMFSRIALMIDNVTYNVSLSDLFIPSYDEIPDKIVIFIVGRSLFNIENGESANILFELEEGDGSETELISRNHTTSKILFNNYLKYDGGTFGGFEIAEPIDQFPHFYVHWQKDVSLLASSIATILTYYYDDAHTEEDVIQGMLQYGDREAIMERQNFSLYDAQSFLQEIGYDAAGYSEEDPVDQEWFREYSDITPYIAAVKLYNRQLFSVVRGHDDYSVYMSIPSMGNIAMSFEEFNNCFLDVLFIFRLAEE